MKRKNIFTSADILLPYDDAANQGWGAWSVIACDQFTSEPEYWEECQKNAGDAASAYNFVLPEAYLGGDKEESHKKIVSDSMKNADNLLPNAIADTLVYLERVLPDGSVRAGIVGKVDLEEYDYCKGSTSSVRATEATVLERIPPRCAIRAEATVELPHVMLFGDEKWTYVIDEVKKYIGKDDARMIYDFELMQGGGHLTGYSLTGKALDAALEAVAYYEDYRFSMNSSAVVYAVGDGNHSLAAAKAHFENLKADLGDDAMTHPARYALVEIVSLGDPSIEFEPIYRLVKDCDPTALVAAFKDYAGKGSEGQSVTVITGDTKETVVMANPAHALTVGTLQIFLDGYLKSAEGECDYIHGEDTTERLAKKDGSVGFIFDGMEKSELFGYVEKYGSLPRKTFSMGEAKSKRYYTEARKIVK